MGDYEPMLQVFSNLVPLVYWIAFLEDGELRSNSLVNGSFNGGWEEKNDLEQGGRATWWQLAKRSPTSLPK